MHCFYCMEYQSISTGWHLYRQWNYLIDRQSGRYSNSASPSTVQHRILLLPSQFLLIIPRLHPNRHKMQSLSSHIHAHRVTIERLLNTKRSHIPFTRPVLQLNKAPESSIAAQLSSHTLMMTDRLPDILWLYITHGTNQAP